MERLQAGLEECVAVNRLQGRAIGEGGQRFAAPESAHADALESCGKLDGAQVSMTFAGMRLDFDCAFAHDET